MLLTLKRLKERLNLGIRDLQQRRMISKISCSRRAIATGEIRISYAHTGFPAPPPTWDKVTGGGAVKYQHLHERVPHAGLDCNIVYAVSSSRFGNMSGLLAAVKKKGISLVWNQNGVYAPFAYNRDTVQKGNSLMALLLHGADYVFFQSEFARLSANLFLGSRLNHAEVLHNAVDTSLFSPGCSSPKREVVLIIAGSHNQAYRLLSAIHTLALIRKQTPARLIVAGRISEHLKFEASRLLESFELGNHIEFVGPYTQNLAPSIYRRANILLHPQYNDVCPTVVLEAMACGLPVVYSKSGGTPELVGEYAGYGVTAGQNWEEVEPPHPKLLMEGVMTVFEDLDRYREAARERVVSKFDIQEWLKHHIRVFEILLEQKKM